MRASAGFVNVQTASVAIITESSRPLGFFPGGPHALENFRRDGVEFRDVGPVAEAAEFAQNQKVMGLFGGIGDQVFAAGRGCCAEIVVTLQRFQRLFDLGTGPAESLRFFLKDLVV